MNIVTNELTGMFLLPLAQTMSLGVWDVINGLGLPFIPFLYIYTKSFFEARAQGLDEGSPAVLAIKLVEKSFIGYVIIIAFVLTPISGQFKVDHRQFSCMDNPSLLNNDLAGANTANNSALSALGVNLDTSPPLYFGLIHQISTGFNEAALSQMTCQKGASANEVVETMKRLIPKTESMAESINSFNQRCYRVAHNKATEAQAANKPLNAQTNTKYNWSFQQPDYAASSGIINSAYSGTLIAGEVNDPLYMEVPDTWFDPINRGENIRCATLAEDLYNKIEQDLRSDSEHEEDTERMLAFASMFNPSLSSAEVTHDMVITVFDNAVAKKTSQDSRWKEGANKGSQTIGNTNINRDNLEKVMDATGYGDVFTIVESALDDASPMDAVTETVVNFGGLITTMSESAKSYAVTLILPMIIIIMQAVMLIALPILMVMSGYSWGFLYNWTLLYFSITLAPFWMNVGIQIETILLSMSNYSDSLWSHALNTVSQSNTDMYIVGGTAATFVYLTPIIWVMLVQIIGNIAGSMFMNMVSGAAIVGQTGADLAQDKAEETAKKTYGAIKDAYNQRGNNFSSTPHNPINFNQISKK